MICFLVKSTSIQKVNLKINWAASACVNKKLKKNINFFLSVFVTFLQVGTIRGGGGIETSTSRDTALLNLLFLRSLRRLEAIYAVPNEQIKKKLNF